MTTFYIDPIILSIGPFNITWYGLSYLFSILIAIYYCNFLTRKRDGKITKQDLESFVTYAILGIIIGGRLGYVCFYNPVKYFHNPIEILKTYEGGMSFHGGFLGLLIAGIVYSKSRKIRIIDLLDLLTPAAPIGLFFGRIANFINGELWGKVTDLPWGVIFLDGGLMPRHPSQLYEAMLEGLIIFIILSIACFKFNSIKKPGLNSGLFCIFYSIFRILVECVREPDYQIGYIMHYFTLGQILSLPILFFGIYLIAFRNLHHKKIL